MERKDKIKALSLLDAGEITIENFAKLTYEKDYGYGVVYLPFKLKEKFAEEIIEKNINLASDENYYDKLDSRLLDDIVFCYQNQHPDYPCECEFKYRDKNDEDCIACDKRRMQKFQSFD